MELKKVFYLTNVTNAVNLSQPGVCIGGGLHAPIHIILGSKFLGNDNTSPPLATASAVTLAQRLYCPTSRANYVTFISM